MVTPHTKSSRNRVVDLRRKTSSATVPSPKKVKEKLSETSSERRQSTLRDRKSPLRTKRRRIRLYTSLVILIAIAAGAYGINYASYLPQFSVTTASVEGTRALSSQLVKNYAESLLSDTSFHFLSPSNVLFFNERNFARAIVSHFPRIENADAKRTSNFDTHVHVVVSERDPVGLWCAPSLSCYLIDHSGFIFASAVSSSSAEQTLYIFHGALATSSDPIGNEFISAHFPSLLATLDRIGQAGFTPRGATADNDHDYEVPLQEGFAIKASFGADASVLSENLKLILSADSLKSKRSDLEYIDLRFGNRAYYKLKGVPDATSTKP